MSSGSRSGPVHGALSLAIITWLAAVVGGCGSDSNDPSDNASSGGPRTSVGPVTFADHVAPILYNHCAVCHQPNGSGPFNLLTYSDARKRARQIATVVESGFMPPWLPEPGHGSFVGERRMSTDEIALIQRWVEGGALEGDPADTPAPPPVTDGWQLGTPDLVVALPDAWTLSAEGTDDFRNFVFRSPVPTTRFVRAVELHPGNKRVVHHAILMVDPTRKARRLDDEQPGPGYEGMDAIIGHAPDGHFLGWTPGKQPESGEGELPWRLDPGTDLVLQLHMVPSGKPEPIRPSIGLYFGEPPPTTERTFTLFLKVPVNIPAGQSAYVAEDGFTLPVDATLERVYPHAHYLGKSIEAFAELPDGSTRWIIRIDDWDFNWQDAYRCAEPIELPKGTAVTMRWTFDNSAENVRNPNDPPQRVVSGNRTTDEMAHLYLQLRVADDLQEQILRIAEGRHRLQRYPDDWRLHTSLAGTLQTVGLVDDALGHARRALEIQPTHAPAHFVIAVIAEQAGQLDEAIYHYEQAVRLEADNPLLRTSLAECLLKASRLSDAERQVLEVLRLDPQISDAHTILGSIRRTQGALGEAIGHYEDAIAIRPDDLMAHTYLGVIRTQQGEFSLAIAHLDHALQISPDNAILHNSLGRVLLADGQKELAVEHFRRAIALQPDYAEPRQRLQEALRTP